MARLAGEGAGGCVRPRHGRVWGHVTAVIREQETGAPVAACVRMIQTGVEQHVPWRYVVEVGDGYRLTIGTGELALMTVPATSTRDGITEGEPGPAHFRC